MEVLQLRHMVMDVERGMSRTIETVGVLESEIRSVKQQVLRSVRSLNGAAQPASAVVSAITGGSSLSFSIEDRGVADDGGAVAAVPYPASAAPASSLSRLPPGLTAADMAALLAAGRDDGSQRRRSSTSSVGRRGSWAS
jgi:hypothetical protein